MLWQISWRVFIKLLVVCMSRLKISKCCYNCRKFFLKLMAYWSCFSWDFVFSWPLNWYCVFLNYAYIIVPLTSIWKCQWWSKLCLVFPKFMDFNKHSMYIPHFRLDMEIIFYIYASVYSVTTEFLLLHNIVNQWPHFLVYFYCYWGMNLLGWFFHVYKPCQTFSLCL